MTGPSWRIGMLVGRSQLRWARRSVSRRRPETPSTWDLHLGPVDVRGASVVVRSPRLTDAAQWREVRLRERSRIERWWSTSPVPWEERHTDAEWVSWVLHARRSARAGRAMPTVIEIDGRLAGEMSLAWIDGHAGTAELGCWVDSRVVRAALAQVSAALVFEHAFTELGLHRISAPVAVRNRAALWAGKGFGLVNEGLMRSYLNVGGQRTDHYLLAMTADQRPPEGMVNATLRELGAAPTAPATAS